MRILFAKYFEIVFWLIALFLLAIFPAAGDFSLCPLHALGFSYCPGCGLGRSIHLAFTGAFIESFKMHPMGIPAIFIIVNRIIRLIKNKITSNHEQSNKPHTTAILV